MEKSVRNVLHLFWLFTKDDAATFVVPNVAFGICGSLSGSDFVTPSNNISNTLLHLPHVVVFNWSNLLIFDLANQRLPESAREDILNKPWRPIPSGMATSVQVRRAMIILIPAILAMNHFILGTGLETALLYILTWLYNDLMGGDEDWILRNVIIAAAFWLYNAGSIKVASGCSYNHPVFITPKGILWTSIISGVILTTMHVQDLKDQEGDKARHRATAPLTLGDRAARWSIAVPICIWSSFCALFWGVGATGWGVILLGVIVAFRCVALSGNLLDRRTWELWALWTATLYTLPVVHTLIH